MQLYRPISEVFDHHAYCDADSAGHDPRYGIRGMLAYRSALLGIKLAHAPVVRFRYVAVSKTHADIDIRRSQNGAEIWGMCLPDSCFAGLGRGEHCQSTPARWPSLPQTPFCGRAE
jgi:hypothetical protein